ncbi:serine/threonine-protein kinase [Nocardia sp. XZ_19_231]|uniref:serine/threonine-protein kinase n=1 Tax=Nocardia sp. XZ_19_231 TaxID=2769252 RepID=UPI00188F007A|nr:serine/threonine-protein kinase [Nocardia sp. XZ_19_231]
MHELGPGDIVAGYRIERVLGSGGMGSVYAARHPRLPRLVAVKLLHSSFSADPVFRGRFEREAELAGRLDHPNIVAIHDRGSEDGRLWIAMQYVAGSDAESALRTGALAPDRALRIARATADALDCAHAAGLLHRDVKPANILLSEGAGGSGERVLLTDFGIAKAIDEATALTRTGTLVATLRYAAPEQLDGRATGPQSDQYSLACTLFHLLAGRPPYTATNAGALVGAHLMQPVPRISPLVPGLPDAVDVVFARALAKDPDHRFASCAQMVAAATTALTTGLAPTRPVTDSAGVLVPDDRGQQVTPMGRQPVAAAGVAGGRGFDVNNRAGFNGAGTRRGSAAWWAVGAIGLVTALTIVTAVLMSRGSGSTVAGPTTTTIAPTTTTLDAWAAARPTIAMFPDLLPASPDSEGYRGLRCSFATKSPQAVWDTGFDCTDREGVQLQVMAHSDAETVGRFVATLPAGATQQLRSRYGRPLTVHSFNGSTGPWLLVRFDAAPYSTVLLQVYWKGHTHQEMIDQWLSTAPL